MNWKYLKIASNFLGSISIYHPWEPGYRTCTKVF